MVFMKEEEVKDLFSKFKIIEFEEEEKDGKTAIGKTKHWHIYNIIAQKK